MASYTRSAEALRVQDGQGLIPREVRIGLVLFGGVSLAIYINGVATEFSRVVRGEGAYRWLKALTHSDVVVDVISGTSAGGINGVALAYALCNGSSMEPLAKVWRHGGDFSELMRPPRHDQTYNSLVAGETYGGKLRDGFDELANNPWNPPTDRTYVSETGELDLFVTGTRLEPRISIEFDSAGHAMESKDHRTVFLLKHRPGRKEPFNPTFAAGTSEAPGRTTLHNALSTLCRLTSGFPVAFPAVTVEPDQPGSSPTADGLLRLWGQLHESEPIDYVDGGVLDNKPFTSTLEAIFSRSAIRPVERVMFFVEPDPSDPAANSATAKTEHRAPNIVNTLYRARINIPFVETTTDDFKRLMEHNRRLEIYHRMTRDLSSQPGAFGIDFSTTPEAVAERDRQAAGIGEPTVVPADAGALDGPTNLLYRRTRLVDAATKIADGIYLSVDLDGARPARVLPGEMDPYAKTMLAKRAEATGFLNAFDLWSENDANVRRLFACDLYYFRRRVYHLIYFVHDRLAALPGDDANAQERGELTLLLDALNRQTEIYEIIRAAIERFVVGARASWRALGASGKPAEYAPEVLWDGLASGIQLLLHVAGDKIPLDLHDLLMKEESDVKGWQFKTLLQDLNNALRVKVQELHKMPPAQIQPGGEPGAVLTRMQAAERRVIQTHRPDDGAVLASHDSFATLDAALFPLEVIGKLGEKDIVEVIRISPADAQRGFSARMKSDKISGDALMHFGGFFKKTWRSNDILWGRLDGSCQILETLLDPTRIHDVVSQDAEGVWARFFDSPFGQPLPSPVPWRSGMNPNELFRQSGEAVADRMSELLFNILTGVSTPAGLKEFTELLIEAEQLEILHTEVPSVFEDSLSEQAKWNRFPYSKKQPVIPVDASGNPASAGIEHWSSVRTSGRFDPFVVVAGVVERVRENFTTVFAAGQTPPRRPRETPLGDYFLKHYRVGTESIGKHIPTLVLLNILAHALLVARTCLLNAAGASGERVRRSALYRIGLDLPLRLFYAITTIWRRTSLGVLQVAGLFAIISAILLGVGISFWREIIWADDQFHLRHFLIFLLGPATVLFGMAGVALVTAFQRHRAWIAIPIFLAVLAVCARQLYLGARDWDEIWGQIDISTVEILPLLTKLVFPCLALLVLIRGSWERPFDAIRNRLAKKSA